MEARFMPGPWAIRRISSPSDRPWLVGKADKSGPSLAAANSEANARLIAAAPELAETEQELADAIAVICPSNAAIEHASLEWKRVYAALKAARAALSKATAS